MNKTEELAHLTAPSPDPKQRMIDYWGKRAEKAEDRAARLMATLELIAAQKGEHWSKGAAAKAIKAENDRNL